MNRLATFLGQFSAVSTHYVTEARLNVIRDSGEKRGLRIKIEENRCTYLDHDWG